MSVAPHPYAGQPPSGMVTAEEHLRVCQQLERVSQDRDHWRQVAEERDGIIQQQAGTIRRQTDERTAIFAALRNKDLTLAERFDVLLTIFDARHDGTKASDTCGVVFNREKVPEGAREVCIRSIATHAGRSDDAVRRSIGRLAGFGLWEKTTITGFNTEQDRPQDVTFIRPPGEDLLDDLRALARLAPTDEKRRAVTAELEPRTNGNGRGKPGPAPGERRVKTIKATCPDCGSSDTRLDCRTCGMRHDTVDLPDEGEERTDDPETVSYGSGAEGREEEAPPAATQPQLTAVKTESKATVTCGSLDDREDATKNTERVAIQSRDGLSPPDGARRSQDTPAGKAPPARGTPDERCACGRLYVILGDGRRRCNGRH